MGPSEKDGQIVRALAGRVAELAALPVQQERVRLWKALNALRPQRPMVLAYPEGGWRDLLSDADLRCEGELLRSWERRLRMTIFHHEHIHDDQPVAGFFNIPWTIRRGDFGLAETRTRTEATGSYTWDPPVKSRADLGKLRQPDVRIDRAETARRVALAESVFGDILPVRVRGTPWWSWGLTAALIHLRGLDRVMLDIYDDPRFLHDLMAFLRDEAIREIDLFEGEGVLSLNNEAGDYVGSGGVGCTDELPAADFDGRARPKDMWVLGESQEFVGVGPQQFDEFALRYQLPILSRFGLVCYGCCEPLDQKFDLVLGGIPKLRRVSVSPWCDRQLAAEKLADRYIFSWKPNPALICGPRVDWDRVERVTRETIRIARGCCLEMVMKDTHTFQGDPTRVERWTRIASRLAREAA